MPSFVIPKIADDGREGRSTLAHSEYGPAKSRPRPSQMNLPGSLAIVDEENDYGQPGLKLAEPVGGESNGFLLAGVTSHAAEAGSPTPG